MRMHLPHRSLVKFLFLEAVNLGLASRENSLNTVWIKVGASQVWNVQCIINVLSPFPTFASFVVRCLAQGEPSVDRTCLLLLCALIDVAIALS
jgi:hypothetical protein